MYCARQVVLERSKLEAYYTCSDGLNLLLTHYAGSVGQAGGIIVSTLQCVRGKTQILNAEDCLSMLISRLEAEATKHGLEERALLHSLIPQWRSGWTTLMSANFVRLDISRSSELTSLPYSVPKYVYALHLDAHS